MTTIAGVDLGARKAAIAVFHDGKLGYVGDLEVPKTTRARELRTLAEWSFGYLKVCDFVFVEEPLVGRGVRASLQVAQTAGAVMSSLGGLLDIKSDLTPNKAWKKALIGNGNASKEEIKSWLVNTYPSYAALCGSSQDRVDAACIGLYGVLVHDRASHLATL